MPRVVFFLIGLLLSVTAGLKLWMLLTDPFADVKTGLSMSLLWLVVFLELGVLWLMIGNGPAKTKWTVCTLVFLLFLLATLVRAFLGYATCGCAGNLTVPPWMSIGVQSLFSDVKGRVQAEF